MGSQIGALEHLFHQLANKGSRYCQWSVKRGWKFLCPLFTDTVTRPPLNQSPSCRGYCLYHQCHYRPFCPLSTASDQSPRPPPCPYCSPQPGPSCSSPGWVVPPAEGGPWSADHQGTVSLKNLRKIMILGQDNSPVLQAKVGIIRAKDGGRARGVASPLQETPSRPFPNKRVEFLGSLEKSLLYALIYVFPCFFYWFCSPVFTFLFIFIFRKKKELWCTSHNKKTHRHRYILS